MSIYSFMNMQRWQPLFNSTSIFSRCHFWPVNCRTTIEWKDLKLKRRHFVSISLAMWSIVTKVNNTRQTNQDEELIHNDTWQTHFFVFPILKERRKPHTCKQKERMLTYEKGHKRKKKESRKWFEGNLVYFDTQNNDEGLIWIKM